MGRGWKRAVQPCTAPVPYPTGEPPRREGHSGRGTSAVVECDCRAQTTGLGGRRLQRAATGLAPSLRSRAWCRLCSAAKVAPECTTAILLGSHNAPAQGNDATTANALAARLLSLRPNLGPGCRRLKM